MKTSWSKMVLLVRTAILLGAGAVLTAALVRLTTDALDPVTRALGAGRAADLDALPFPRVLCGGAAVALLSCWTRVAVAGAVFAVRVLVTTWCERPPLVSGSHRRPTAPRLVRSTVLAALGLALPAAVVAPAHADPVTRPSPDTARLEGAGLAGLELPDRTVGATSGPRVVTVRPGDSLWSIAETLLPHDAAAREVARVCRRLHAANASTIGPDADLIFPGTRLVVPRRDRPGKEQP